MFHVARVSRQALKVLNSIQILFKMSTKEATVLIQETIVTETVEQLLADTFEIIAEKFYKLQGVAMYQQCLMQALQEILYVYDKPKPCNDHSHIIEAWQRDKPATPSTPDSLLRDLFKKIWNDDRRWENLLEIGDRHPKHQKRQQIYATKFREDSKRFMDLWNGICIWINYQKNLSFRQSNK